MKQVYEFLGKLHRHNNRDWFNAHKDDYLAATHTFNSFVQELIEEVYKFDKDINPSTLSIKDCTYRIYRDIRFSKDKSPYKTHMGAYLVRGGKKSNYSGYYFHIQPFSGSIAEESMMCVGAYMPDAKQIASVREEIMLNGTPLLNSIKKAKGFYLYEENSLKRVPSGFNAITDKELQRLLKLRQYLVMKSVTPEYIFKPNLAKRVANEFKKCYEFNSIINRCIEYAIEEGTNNKF